MSVLPAVRRLVSICAIALAACTSLPSLPDLPKLPGLKVYRIEIQQGNYITQEMVAQLKNGMTREQVRFVLGTPLVTDIFHSERWDYVFYRERSSGEFEQRKFTVFFDKEGRLERMAGDVVPAAAPSPPAAPVATPVATPAATPTAASVPAPAIPAPVEKSEPAPKPEAAPPEEGKERGFFGRMLEKIGF